MILQFKECVFFMLIVLSFIGCYNFKGLSIPPEIETFKVESFTLIAESTPIGLDQLFTERLRKKIREESRLINENTNPDITFSGQITQFKISYVAPDGDNTASLNRLEIALKIFYTNANNEKENWSKSYGDFEDFDSNTDFQSIQDDLISEIMEDLVEKIFNDSFTNW